MRDEGAHEHSGVKPPKKTKDKEKKGLLSKTRETRETSGNRAESRRTSSFASRSHRPINREEGDSSFALCSSSYPLLLLGASTHMRCIESSRAEPTTSETKIEKNQRE